MKRGYYNIFLRDIKNKISMDRLISKIVGISKINLLTLMSKTRRRNVVYARHAIVFYAVKEGYGYSEIGRKFNKTHATIISSYKKACELIDTNNKDFLKLIL